MLPTQVRKNERLPPLFRREEGRIRINQRRGLLLGGSVVLGSVALGLAIDWLRGNVPNYSGHALFAAVFWTGLLLLVLACRDQLDRGPGSPRITLPRIGLGGILLLMAIWAAAFAIVGWDRRSTAARLAMQERVMEELTECVPNVRVRIVGPRNEAWLFANGGNATDADLVEIDRILSEAFPEGPLVRQAILIGPGVTDDGISVVGGWQAMQHLTITSPNVTDGCLPDLLQLRRLEDFSYGGTAISEATIDRLIEELPQLGSERRSGAVFDPD